MNVVSIPAGAPFLKTLAGALMDSPTLADDVVLLPTHRAGRALVEAFAEAADGGTLLLPRILSLGELDADEIAIRAEAEPGLADDLSLKPAIPALARRLLLARLVMQRDRQIPPDRALQLAGALARLIDEVQFNQLDFGRLDALVPEEFAEHWQETLDFLSIVTKAWPAILEEQGRLDPIDRRNRLYKAQIALWRKAPPEGRVIAAGSTGIMPATADLLACIAGLPRGLVVLPGLDRHLDDGGWEAVEEGHPQWALKHLLERLGVERAAVPDWLEERPSPRSRLVAEAMRPAETTEAWRSLAPEIGDGAEGLTVARFANPAAEAGAVALMLREAVERGRSAALVTPDRDLARRVSIELGRWDLLADDSAGQPLGRRPRAPSCASSPMPRQRTLRLPNCWPRSNTRLRPAAWSLRASAGPSVGWNGRCCAARAPATGWTGFCRQRKERRTSGSARRPAGSPALSRRLRRSTASRRHRLPTCWRRMSRRRRSWPAKPGSGAARTGKRRRSFWRTSAKRPGPGSPSSPPTMPRCSTSLPPGRRCASCARAIRASPFWGRWKRGCNARTGWCSPG